MALTKPFAEQGEKKAISLTPDAEGTMNYQDGFGQRYSLPVKSTISEDGTITTTGGLWIQREQFNQLMFDTTSAIIENQDNITQLNQDLGDKGDLTTTNKDNIVSAINELDSNIGDLQDLTTTEKSNVVSAVNEIDSNYVRLDTEQTIPSVKTFSNVVNFGSIVNVNGEANFNNNVEMVNTPTITNPKTFQDLIDNELITKAQSVSKFVDFDTNQSVSGLKTFTTLPQSDATPTNDKDLTTKLYVDTTLSDKIAEIGKAMGFKGIVENATDLPTDTATDGDMYYNKASSGETEDNKKGFYVFNGTAFDFIGATISMDFDKIFEIEEKQGDLTQLKTTAKDSLVNAINENYDNIATNSNNIGTLGNLTTTAKDNLVNAINENKASIDTNKSEIDSSLGDLTQLKTTAKDSLVNAINENYDSIETNSQHIAENEGAISTINDNIGDLQNLTTTAKTSVVNAINEIDNSLKNNHFVTLDTNQTITSLKTFDKLPQSSVTPANDTDLVTKAYVDTQVADIDTTNLAKLDSNNQFTGENTFDIIPKSNGTPANDTDLATKKYIDDVADNKVSKTGPERIEGVKTFASIPLCSPQPTANIQLANKAYVDKKVSKTGDETIQGNKTFSNPPICNTQPTDDNQLANKAYVDSVTGGFAGLDKANTFTQTNTFEGEVTLSTIANTPTITNPNEWATLGDNGIPTKKQIIDNIQGGGGGGNYLPLNIDTDTEVTTTAGSNAQLSLNFTDSTIAQGATFEISNQEHNIQFSKDAGINNIKLNQNLEFKLDSNINADVIFSDDYTKQKFQNALEIGSAGVTLDTEQTITGKKLFSKIQSTQAIAEDNDLTSKAYVDKAIADLGDTITLDGYAKLAEANTFTALNTFDVLPQSTATPADPKDLITKQYNDDRLTGVENNINTKIGNLTQLTTNAKDNLVNAINEIKAGAGGDATNMDLKGTKATYQEIEDLADMVMGDVWECSEVGKEGFYIYDGAAWKLLGSGGGTPTPPTEITLNPNPVITFTVAPTEWTDVTDIEDKKLRGNYKVTKNIDKKGVTNAIFISATSTVTNINYGSILGISIKLVVAADAVTQVEIYSYSKPEADVTLLVDLLLVIQEAAYGVGIFNIKQDGSFIYTQTEYDSLELGAKTNGLIYVVQG